MRVSKTQTRASLTRRRALHAYFGPNIFDLYCSWKRPEEEKYMTTSSHAQTRLAWPLSDKTRMRTAQDIADDLSFFWTILIFFCICIIAAKLSEKLLCCLKIRSNAKIVCHKQNVMTRVASNIQSSSRRNSGRTPAVAGLFWNHWFTLISLSGPSLSSSQSGAWFSSAACS